MTAKKDIKAKEGTIAEQKADIEKKTESIGQLTEQKDALQEKTEKQAGELTKLNEKITDRESQLDAAKRYVEKLERQLEGITSTNALPSGLQGQVLYVNTKWNFVVMDILPESEIMPTTDLTVQRNDKLVGKIHVTEVMRHQKFAVGEVLSDWQQMPIAKGDYVFY